jgi:type IV fimbrial biogenesis protein FimT
MLTAQKQSGLRHKHDGFTLLEIVIAIALMCILTVLAVPAFQHWVQNAQIRNGAEGILNGLQHARAEAVRRNVVIQFVLVNQSGWQIAAASDPATILVQRDPGEGSSNALVATSPAGADRISFNGMGWVVANGDASPSLATMDVTSATLAGSEIRPLRIVVSTNGAPKMCDPSPSLAAGDPRICP